MVSLELALQGKSGRLESIVGVGKHCGTLLGAYGELEALQQAGRYVGNCGVLWEVGAVPGQVHLTPRARMKNHAPLSTVEACIRKGLQPYVQTLPLCSAVPLLSTPCPSPGLEGTVGTEGS